MSETDILNRLAKQRKSLKQRCDQLLDTPLFGYEIDAAMDAFHESADDVKAIQKEIDVLFGRFGDELKELLDLLQELPKAIAAKIEPYKSKYRF